MKLHKDKKLFKDAIRFTAQQLSLPPEYIEKDYWITFSLYTIYSDEIGKEVIFKGGTSLSKCFNIIDRFSEDIDLVLLKKDNDSSNKLKSKLKRISSLLSVILPEIEVAGISRKRGMNRKTAHLFNKEFLGDYGQIRDMIIVESSWLSSCEPYTKKMINSFIGQMLLNSNQAEIANNYNMTAFEVLTLEPTRTFCEKIMSLTRFSYEENPIWNLQNKIRHTYDLHQLLKSKEISNFFLSGEFDNMLLKVAKDDVISFKNNNKWLKNHPKEAIIFKDLHNTWKLISPTYKNEFKNLVYKELPNPELILKSLAKIKNRLLKVNWKIDLKN